MEQRIYGLKSGDLITHDLITHLMVYINRMRENLILGVTMIFHYVLCLVLFIHG